MFKKFIILSLLFIFSIAGFSQNNVNNYKYIIVPVEYSFLKEPDQYRLNSLSKFLFEKYGFTAIMSDAVYPDDLSQNFCLALRANVIGNPGAFKTKIKVELKNCKNETVYVSPTGESFEKENKVAYNLAMREAFSYLATLNYTYEPGIELVNKTPVVKETVQVSEPVAVVETIVETPVKTQTIQEEIAQPNILERSSLTANKTANGYKLLDSNNKEVMVLLSTKNPDVFMVQGENAMVIKEDNAWYLSENKNNQVIDTKLNITF